MTVARHALPELPSLPATGLPAEVLKQRPDVQAARLRVEAADQRVGAVLAERFLPLVLSGSIGLAATSITGAYNLVWNLLMGLSATILDGGRREARVEQSRAVHCRSRVRSCASRRLRPAKPWNWRAPRTSMA